MIEQSLMAEFKDMDEDFVSIYKKIAPFIMTSIVRLFDLY